MIRKSGPIIILGVVVSIAACVQERTSSAPSVSEDSSERSSAPSVSEENVRISGAPFISGDRFRSASDHKYDETSRDMNPADVKFGDIVFLKTDYLEEYFANIHPSILHRYILITHNSDYHVPGNYAAHLDDNKIIAWFGQNVENCDHPKMQRIPIGIANRIWPHGNVEAFKEAQLKIDDGGARPILLYMNFSPSTFLEERSIVAERFKGKPYCVVSEPKAMPAYLADLGQTKFVLSPRGNGLDCHRTWEALLMGAIPIVKKSSLDSMYEGLPVLIINDWDEIDETFLNRKYEEIRANTFYPERAYIDFWLRKIRSFTPRAAVTYDRGGGRFGDKLLGYLHAKWISYRYNMPLLYQPFLYSDQLVLHRSERLYETADAERFEQTIHPNSTMNESFQSDVSALYIIPFFPEAQWEHTPQNAWYSFPVDWEDPRFKSEIKRLVAPLSFEPKLQLPKDRITIAVHMRLGGGFDTDDAKRGAPLKLPPVNYYKEQIRHIYDLLKGQPLYVHVFTDDDNPKRLVDECRDFTKDLDIEYGYRSDSNAHDSNVIEDFFEITRFDCLIRAESNFSITAAKVSDFRIEISPKHFTWTSQDTGHVDQVDVKYRDVPLR